MRMIDRKRMIDADELIERAHDAMDDNDYGELFDIVNLLYELDERE